MTRRIGNVTVIEETAPAKCELCAKEAELRPYGPKGENICFACGQANPEAIERAMRKMFGIK